MLATLSVWYYSGATQADPLLLMMVNLKLLIVCHYHMTQIIMLRPLSEISLTQACLGLECRWLDSFALEVGRVLRSCSA